MNNNAKKDSFRFLRDKIANRILTDEKNRDYVVMLISKATNLDFNMVNKSLRLKSDRINSNIKTKNSEVDAVYIADDAFVNIEVVYCNTPDYKKKETRYVCHLVLDQIMPGESDIDLKPVYQITLDSFDRLKLGNFIYVCGMCELETKKVIEDYPIKLVHINLDYLGKLDYNELIGKEEYSLEKLLLIFTCRDEKIFEKLYKNDNLMKEVGKRVKELTNNFDEMLYYDSDELFEKATMYMAKERLREEGKAEGKREIARNMLEENYDEKSILKIIKITAEELDEIKKALKEKQELEKEE